MKSIKVAVVGGGITGVVVAAKLASKGHQTTIYETAASLGGVLQDVVLDGERFYRGCQYLPENPAWLSSLISIEQLQTFDDQFNSLTNIAGFPPTVCEGFGQPAIKGQHNLEAQDQLPNGAAERLALYGVAGTELAHWASAFNITQSLHHSNLNAMQLDRVFFADMLGDVVKLKQQSSVMDSVLGIPSRLRDQHAPKARASLPRGGYDSLFASIGNRLSQLGVNVETRSPVTPHVSGNQTLGFRVRRHEIEADLVVWCGNPTALIYLLSGIRLEAGPVETTTVFGIVESSRTENPFYWQVFDSQMNLFRHFSWKEGDRVKFAAEATRATEDKISRDLSEFLAQIEPEATLSVSGSINEERWINTTENDHELIVGLGPIFRQNNVVSGAWETFAREAKVTQIISEISQLGYL